jgi:hypothetical protein
LTGFAIAVEPIEPIPETSPAERVAADVHAIGAPAADAERVRDSVPLWFHTVALSPGIYTPGIARDHGYRLACRQGRTPGRRRAGSARAEDRCSSTPVRAQLEPDE